MTVNAVQQYAKTNTTRCYLECFKQYQYANYANTYGSV